jgi:ABC-type multidrug transport system ATPase subunit
MEEAEVLSDRIGIIINGELKCLGTQYKLRKTYGKGFKLVINVKADIDKENELSEEFSKIENLIKSIFPNSGIIEKYKNTLVFHVFIIN